MMDNQIGIGTIAKGMANAIISMNEWLVIHVVGFGRERDASVN
jgi:hypothetical protein